MAGSRGTLRGGVEYDLHNHTDRSRDCRLSGQRLIEFAARRGLKGLGICEHDAFPDETLFDVARELDLDLALGVEFTCAEVHLIGYGMTLSATDRVMLEQRFQAVAENGVRVAEDLIQGLGRLGVELDAATIARYAGKPLHVGFVLKYLVEELRCFPDLAGARTFLHKEGLVLADDHGLSPMPVEQVISIIHASGGKAVWAHPFFTPEGTRQDRLLELVEAGIDGVEAVYAYRENGYAGPESNAVLEARMLAMLHGLPLFITGGSDSHFPVRTDELFHPITPGDAGIPEQDTASFRDIFK